MSPRWVVLAALAVVGGGTALAGTIGPENRDLALVSQGPLSLNPGAYRVVVTATDEAGNTSAPKRAKLWLLPKRKRRAR